MESQSGKFGFFSLDIFKILYFSDDKWDDRDAKVVCRMLGFSSDGAFATTLSQFGLVSGDFIMDDVQCKGAETDINDCYHRDQHNCGAGEGAGVRCRVSPFDDELKDELEEIKDENERLKETVNAQQTKLSAQETKLSDQDSELRALKTKLVALETSFKSQETKINDLSSNLTELESTVDFDDTVLTDLISSSDEFSNHISSFNDSLTSLATSVDEHETKLSSHHDQIHSVIVKAASNSRNIDNISTVVDVQETKVDRVAQDVLNLQASDQQQETRIVDNIKKLKSVSTHGKWCGYQSQWNTANSIITYDSLKYSSSNMNIRTPLNINRGNKSHACYFYLVISMEMRMDINVCHISGIFTVPEPGAWRVSFSLYS